MCQGPAPARFLELLFVPGLFPNDKSLPSGMDENLRASSISIAAKTLSRWLDPFLFSNQTFQVKQRAPPSTFNSKSPDENSFESRTSVIDERDFVRACRMSPTAFQNLFRAVRRVSIKKAAGIRSKRQNRYLLISDWLLHCDY